MSGPNYYRFIKFQGTFFHFKDRPIYFISRIFQPFILKIVQSTLFKGLPNSFYFKDRQTFFSWRIVQPSLFQGPSLVQWFPTFFISRIVLQTRFQRSSNLFNFKDRPTTTIAVGDPLQFKLETQEGENLLRYTIHGVHTITQCTLAVHKY